MSAVTANAVVSQPADCYIFWLRRLQSSSCCSCPSDETAGLSRPEMLPAHHWREQPYKEAPIHADTCRPSPPACRRCTNRKPVKFTQDGRDVIKLPGLCCNTSFCISSKNITSQDRMTDLQTWWKLSECRVLQEDRPNQTPLPDSTIGYKYCGWLPWSDITGTTFHWVVDRVLVRLAVAVCRLKIAHQVQQIVRIAVQLKTNIFVNTNANQKHQIIIFCWL